MNPTARDCTDQLGAGFPSPTGPNLVAGGCRGPGTGHGDVETAELLQLHLLTIGRVRRAVDSVSTGRSAGGVAGRGQHWPGDVARCTP